MRLREAVDCAECGDEHPLEDWIRNGDDCPSCGTPHVVPRLHAAADAVRDGEMDGSDFLEVVESFGLDHDDAANLLLVLGVSADAVFDVERTVVQGWPRSEWRRLIDETREEESEHFEEVERILGRYGVKINLD